MPLVFFTNFLPTPLVFHVWLWSVPWSGHHDQSRSKSILFASPLHSVRWDEQVRLSSLCDVKGELRGAVPKGGWRSFPSHCATFLCVASPHGFLFIQTGFSRRQRLRKVAWRSTAFSPHMRGKEKRARAQGVFSRHCRPRAHPAPVVTPDRLPGTLQL